jgi:membrane complex biogenesis BtpA family protein
VGTLRHIFGVEKPVIGMLHAPALPGAPGFEGDWERVRARVLADAEALAEGGVDGFLLENFGDAPYYPRRVPPHTVAFLTVLGQEVRRRFAQPLGVNVLRNDARSALAIATAIGAEFIRVNVYTGVRITDQGVIAGEAHLLLRDRTLLGSSVKIFADVAVKHSAPLAPRDLALEILEAIERGRADAIILSGAATGQETSLEHLREAKAVARTTPVLVGSGVTMANVESLLREADGVIVGTFFKQDGVVHRPVDAERVRVFMHLVRSLRRGLS